MDRLEIAKAKTLRGDIIKTLYDVYSEEILMGMLRNLLRYKSYNSENDIKKAADYLLGREFIEIKPSDVDYWAATVKLTSNGVNLAEGDDFDKGVLLDE